MRRIILEPVDNGLIQTILDDNIDGVGTKFEQKKIFILGDDITLTEAFLKNFITELGLYTGNQNDKDNLHIEKRFGDNYKMTSEEKIKQRKVLTVQLNKLKEREVNE